MEKHGSLAYRISADCEGSMCKSVAAALFSVFLVSCSNEEPFSQQLEEPAPKSGFRGTAAGEWNRQRLDLYVATPENAPSVQKCIREAIQFDSNRRVEQANRLDRTCQGEMLSAPEGACRNWASIASRVAGKFVSMSEDPMRGSGALKFALEDAEAAAIACNKSLGIE